jgi:hypothetical protein
MWMDRDTKETGKWAILKDSESLPFQMDQNTKVNGSEVNTTERVYIRPQVVRNTTESG